jgi:hypothetical protein
MREVCMKYLKTKWTALAAVCVGIAVFAAFSFRRGNAPEYFTEKVDRGDIHDLVEATGTINAVKTVQVGSQVSGTISKLLVDFNSPVKQGQVIAEIEPSLFQGALLQAKADLQDAQANAATAKANLTKAQANAAQTQQDYKRTVALAQEGVFSQQQLDISKANNDAALAAVSATRAQVTTFCTVVGFMRICTTRPVNEVFGNASTLNVTVWPTLIEPTSDSSVLTSTCILLRSWAMLNSTGACRDAATVCPTSTLREMTMPLMGETIVE